MKYYLSSYKFGDESARLRDIFGANKKVALISNALDFSDDKARLAASEKEQLDGLKLLGLSPEPLDLRNYFGQRGKLHDALAEFSGVWVRGGNTFVLRVAYELSGFTAILRERAHGESDFVYGGYSAGVYVLQPTLRGLELVDHPQVVSTTYDHEIIWDGLAIIDYCVAPHYKSDHPESVDVDRLVRYYEDHKIAYKSLRDGEVIVII